MSPRQAACLFALALSAPVAAHGAPKPHAVALGAAHRVPYSPQGDPAGAAKTDTALFVRPLIIDGRVRDWTTGDAHSVTERSFTVRRAVRLNDALPTDRDPRWVWQRGPWLLIDRVTGRIAALHLPDYDPAVSAIVWFRDYAAYCGVNSSGKQLLAVVAQIEARRPLLAKKLAPWNPADHPAPACAPAVWQRDPLRISFQPTGAAPADFDLVGASAVLVEDGDTDEP